MLNLELTTTAAAMPQTDRADELADFMKKNGAALRSVLDVLCELGAAQEIDSVLWRMKHARIAPGDVEQALRNALMRFEATSQSDLFVASQRTDAPRDLHHAILWWGARLNDLVADTGPR
jgi:hypothetical protein